ncbi:hypothetical protein NZ698_12440 [Chryseobacterium sp. PBS4-4]|uniref:DUF4199 domain-containing protein n=1 Tax=Chryseobacterium edaphi TaxID=2976532 RepID=A0ABT2W719_9FLAO|nr:hypothetical protein [Chryseobacterium edaphi]MCU7618010.1 hypothetical protein [Chryseobacterium edaphi]
MDELELLKEDWNKNKNEFKNYSATEIYSMIKEKSISVTKTLLIIGLIEVILWFIIGYIDSEFPYLRIGLFTVFFIFIIYSFKKIKVSQNSISLMSNILNLRKMVLGYALISILVIVVNNIVNFKHNTQDFMAGYQDGKRNGTFNATNPDSLTPELINYVVFAIALIMAIFFLYWIYKNTYGKILVNLKNNYQELKKS